MHKFFCCYNNLTERYELTKSKQIFYASSYTQANQTLLKEIKENIQSLYNNIASLKDKETNEDKLIILDDSELLISNLYYSLFASPLELNHTTTTNNELLESIKLATLLEREINIPEYNRLISSIKNNLLLLNTPVAKTSLNS